MGLLQNLFGRGRREASFEERRRSPRYVVEQPSEIYLTHRPLTAVLTDVSIHGAQIATRFPREVGEVVGVTIDVDGVPMVLPMRLLWRRMADGVYRFGGLFVDLTDQEQHHLGRFVALVRERRGRQLASA